MPANCKPDIMAPRRPLISPPFSPVHHLYCARYVLRVGYSVFSMRQWQWWWLGVHHGKYFGMEPVHRSRKATQLNAAEARHVIMAST
mmetsp:Transcript_40092/g.65073  ORF Transcript_40092/g.65073 Transcript_40092/m.65073 type:complete len:87 (-) Transcript_40092:165-425(-)